MQSITIIIISHAASSSAKIMASTMSHIICHTSTRILIQLFYAIKQTVFPWVATSQTTLTA